MPDALGKIDNRKIDNNRPFVVRTLTTVIIVLAIGALGFFGRRLGGHFRPPDDRILLLRMVVLPIVVVALSLLYRRHQRIGSSTGRFVAQGILLSATIAPATELVLHFALSDAPRRPFSTLLSEALFFSLITLALWALAFLLPHVADDTRIQALEMDRVQRMAELAQLRSQIEPHFLMNTLNTIAGLVVSEPKEARRLIGSLGDLFRESHAGVSGLRSLAEELQWIRGYAGILESRHGAVLRFHWEIDDTSVAVMLPPLVLQPLVENAVKHGALKRQTGGAVTIRAEREANDTIVCSVSDNGPGFDPSTVREGALGLALVKKSLELHAPRAKLRLKSSPAGTLAEIELPVPA